MILEKIYSKKLKTFVHHLLDCHFQLLLTCEDAYNENAAFFWKESTVLLKQWELRDSEKAMFCITYVCLDS